MTDQSRVEAVAAPIERALRSAGMSEDLIKIVRVSTAELVIAASDAWLKQQGVVIPQLPATKLELESFYRGKATDLGEELMDEALARRGIRLRSPSSEEVDR